MIRISTLFSLFFVLPVSATDTPAVHGDVTPPYQVSILSDTAKDFNTEAHTVTNTPLALVRLAVDVENITLRNLVQDIVTQAAEHTGPWKVKWRLKPENTSLLSERVNLIAEGTFNDFTYHLGQRVKNMSGIQLFFTNFDAARVIIVSDTQ